MTLDEAIKHCEERAEQDCTACASEHKQLAEWLIELKGYKDSFYSNCIFEAAKAKARNLSCKIYFVFGNVDGIPFPHMFWDDGNYYYNFYATSDVHLYNVLWHKGCIQRFHKSEMHRKLYKLF